MYFQLLNSPKEVKIFFTFDIWIAAIWNSCFRIISCSHNKNSIRKNKKVIYFFYYYTVYTNLTCICMCRVHMGTGTFWWDNFNLKLWSPGAVSFSIGTCNFLKFGIDRSFSFWKIRCLFQKWVIITLFNSKVFLYKTCQGRAAQRKGLLL